MGAASAPGVRARTVARMTNTTPSTAVDNHAVLRALARKATSDPSGCTHSFIDELVLEDPVAALDSVTAYAVERCSNCDGTPTHAQR
jgi:hypothetical protein